MYNDELEDIAKQYHLNADMKDKFIEDISQFYFCDWIKEKFACNRHVCEMGYGEGITTRRLGSYFQNYSVVEGSSALCEKARSELKQVKVVHSLFEDYRPKKKYDMVLALHVLEHVDKPKDILDQIKLWLKPGGVLIVLVPNKRSLHRLFALNMGMINELDDLSDRDVLVGHQRVYDLTELRGEMERAQFKVTDEKGFFLKTVPNYMMINYKHELIMELNKISADLDPSILANICLVGEL